MFNPINQIAKMNTYVFKLVNYFKTKGIEFQFGDEGLENVVISSKEKTIKISYHSFYRYSGIACYCRDKEGTNNQSETVEITDEMFYENVIKVIIKTHFNLK